MEKHNPFELFASWYNEAKKLNSREKDAMAVATCSPEGKPSVRMVLLKSFNDDGFVFFTNFNSRKGKEILSNPHIELCFNWELIGKQVRVKGNASQVSEKEAEEYFQSRFFLSRVGAWASKQSRPMWNRSVLALRLAIYLSKYYLLGKKVPRPEFWSGFRIKPEYIEFWENTSPPTRTIYRADDNGWQLESLYP